MNIAMRASDMFALVIYFCLSYVGESSKILGVFPSPGYSQFILAERLMTELANRGHEVIVICPFEPQKPVKGYKTIMVDGILEDFRSVDLFTWKYRNSFYNLFDMYANLGFSMTENALSHPKVQALIHSNQTFDVVISEIFVNEAHMGFAHHFKAPLILFSSLYPTEWINSFVANPAPPSYVVHSGSGYTTPMNLWERVRNLFYYTYDVLLREFYLYPNQESLLKRYFPNAPDLRDLIYNVSLILLNSHPSYTEAVPVVPNMIDIAGFHVTDELLKYDLKRFLDESKEGVIYFSMGSNLKSKNLSPENRKVLMDVFRKLPVRVLWKFEDENLPNKPENVKILKWLPQRGILGHPNVKAFISHCGFISTTEAVYFGVPFICIPIYVDQHTNAAFSAKNGVAVTLKFTQLSEKTLSSALDKVLNNKSYSANAKLRSKLLHDRPMKPIDTAMYWIEFVIRNKGAPHLKSVGLKVRWYQFLYLDAIALLVIVFAFIRVTYQLCFKLRSRFWESKKKHD